MNLTHIYQKTNKGFEEIRSRRYKLPKKPRVLLILVDGKTPLDVVLGQARALGIEESVVGELIAEGFISLQAPLSAAVERAFPGDHDAEDSFRTAQRFMNESVVNALGVRAIFFTMKLERCATLADLRGLLDAYERALAKSGDPVYTEILTAKARSLVS